MAKLIIITLALVAVAAAYPGYDQGVSHSAGSFSHDSGFENSQGGGFGGNRGYDSGLGYSGHHVGFGGDGSHGSRGSHEEHEAHYSYGQSRGK